MRVMLFVDGAGGGASTHYLNLARGMAARGMDPILLFHWDGPTIEQAREFGMNVHRISCRFPMDPTLPWRASRFLRRERIDIVHTHTITSTYNARLAKILVRPMPAVITTVHSYLIDELKGNRRITTWDRLRYLRDSWLSALTDHFIAVSRGLEKRMVESGIPRQKVTVVSNGIAFEDRNAEQAELHELRSSLHFAEEDVVIGVVGRLVPVKNHALFLRAARKVADQLPRARFLIVGDGTLRNSLELLTREFGLDRRVVFTGWQNRLAAFYRLMDILVQCSTTESQGLAVLEAMAHGTPVVATDVNDMGKTVIHNETGLLVPSDAAEALADAVLSQLRDRDHAERMAAAAKELVAKKHSCEQMVENTIAVYEEVLRQRGN